MAHKTSKSAGWSFKPPKQEINLIQYTCSVEPIDAQLFNHLRDQIQSTDDLIVLFNILPPIEQLIAEIPYTLPLLEALYLKCELKSIEEELSLPIKQLCCEQLFCQLVWWTAFCEQNRVSSQKKHLNMFTEFEPCVVTLMGIIGRQCTDLVKRAHEDKCQLKTCLESLGCHGLVNCSSGLIRMTDAVHMELMKHVENLKLVLNQIKDIQDTKPNGPDPSFESHQRQMNMRLSQVFERLKLNETLQCVLEEIFHNQHLGSLLRICRKRVSSDKLLIGLFNAFSRAAPEDFSLHQMDPVVAQLIVMFNNSYDKLLSLCPDDLTIHSKISSGSSTTSGSNGTPSIGDSNKSSISAGDSLLQFDSLKQEISKLRKELRVANYTIAQLREKEEEEIILKESCLPAPDYPDAPSFYTTNSLNDLVTRLGELFVYSNNDLRDALDNFPEFEDDSDLAAIFAHELLIKVYITIRDYIDDRQTSVLKAIGGGENSVKKCKELDLFLAAIKTQIYKEYKSDEDSNDIKQALKDVIVGKLESYNGLEDCNELNTFIDRCISISFDIHCCQEKEMCLEYEGIEFEPDRHSRAAYSGTGNKIEHFVWPALIDVNNRRVLLKAIVLT